MNISRAVSPITIFRRRYHPGRMFLRIAACAVLVAVCSAPQLAAATIAHMVTDLGKIDIQLYDDQVPKTVVNFLRYAGRGDYNGTVIHRSEPGFIIQGGGHTCGSLFGQLFCFHILTDAPIQNEFSPTRSNVRGTITMAKVGGNPDSATSEWFFNLANNGSIIDPNTGQQIGLDYQNGGFTVFWRSTYSYAWHRYGRRGCHRGPADL